jgi:hypothetical protein
MTSGTPEPCALGAKPTTRKELPATSARLNSVLNSHATPMLVWPIRKRVAPYLKKARMPMTCGVRVHDVVCVCVCQGGGGQWMLGLVCVAVVLVGGRRLSPSLHCMGAASQLAGSIWAASGLQAAAALQGVNWTPTAAGAGLLALYGCSFAAGWQHLACIGLLLRCRV